MQSPYTEIVKTYTFKVVIEPDEGGYHAYCPALRRFGAVTQGTTQEEALIGNWIAEVFLREIQMKAKPIQREILAPKWRGICLL